MFNKRRSEIEIMGDILHLSQSGARKTQILYQSNMSFSQLQNYLSFLIENDLLKEDKPMESTKNSNKVYITTRKGKDFLKDVSNIMSYFE